jgi:hypothetical protein
LKASASRGRYTDFSRWACGATTPSKFVGCCTSDPCSKGCAQGDIRPAGFNATYHGKFPDASCGSSQPWSCTAGPSFWGCCNSNPCATGICPVADIAPAFLDRPEQFAFYAPSATSSATPSASSTPGGDSTSSNGAIIGGAAGGGAVAIIIIGIIVFICLRRRRRNRKQVNPESGGAYASTSLMKERPEDRRSAQQGYTRKSSGLLLFSTG